MTKLKFIPRRQIRTTVASATLTVLAFAAWGADIPVPNGSFESQSGAGLPFGVNNNIDSWQKYPNPGGDQATGVFVGTSPNSPNPYTNLQGTQAAYVAGLPGAGLFQDDQTTDWSGSMTGLSATYQVGLAYQFTLGVFGKSMPENAASLQLSLYYRDGSTRTTIGSPTTITFNSTTFNPAGPFTLVDYSVLVPIVQSTDAWAGKNIGISILAATGNGNGYWDMDNARLTSFVPEPGVLSLIAFGAGAFFLARRRLQRG
jgi:hypothetical protein